MGWSGRRASAVGAVLRLTVAVFSEKRCPLPAYFPASVLTGNLKSEHNDLREEAWVGTT